MAASAEAIYSPEEQGVAIVVALMNRHEHTEQILSVTMDLGNSPPVRPVTAPAIFASRRCHDPVLPVTLRANETVSGLFFFPFGQGIHDPSSLFRNAAPKSPQGKISIQTLSGYHTVSFTLCHIEPLYRLLDPL